MIWQPGHVTKTLLLHLAITHMSQRKLLRNIQLPFLEIQFTSNSLLKNITSRCTESHKSNIKLLHTASGGIIYDVIIVLYASLMTRQMYHCLYH